MRKAFIYLLFVQLADYVTTAYLVAKQGFTVEANPWLLHLMQLSDSHYAILWYKLIAYSLYSGSMFLLYKRHPERFALPFWRWVVYAFNTAYTLVILRTLYMIFLQQ
jgi:hypothetical protein